MAFAAALASVVSEIGERSKVFADASAIVPVKKPRTRQ